MQGIIFFKSQKLEQLTEFYEKRVGCNIWLKQADCTIFKYGNMLFGFCDRDSADTNGIICFVQENREDVDNCFDKFKDIAESEPIFNPKYEIYHFFARDPEGRLIEFQSFEKLIVE